MREARWTDCLIGGDDRKLIGGDMEAKQITEEKQNLEENFDKIKNDCNKYEFGTARHAHDFQALVLRAAMKRLGVNRAGSYQQPLIGDKVMAEKGVTIHVNKNPMNEIWRLGAYIFKKEEIVYFVSLVTEKAIGTFDIDRRKRWGVVTNVPVS